MLEEIYAIVGAEHINAGLIVLASIMLAVIYRVILNRYVAVLASKTKTTIDDIIVNKMDAPGYVIIILIGLYLALKSLASLAPYAGYIDAAMFILVAITITKFFADIMAFIIGHWLKVRDKGDKAPELVMKFGSVFVYIIGAIIILSHFNIEISPLIATLGIGSLAVGLALQGTLSNFFAGLHLIYDKPIKVGDYIEIDPQTAGTVEDIGWRSTRIRTLTNVRVIIPNAKLAESVIINDSLPDKQLYFPVSCGVSYGSDLDKVEKTAIEIGKKIQKTVPGAVPEHVPFVRFYNFGESNIEFNTFLLAKTPTDKFIMRHEFIKALKKEFERKGIEISYPVRKIYYPK
ncbi:MAG: mechanosensitive ion channel family protein [Candidatus Micrarchaeota archaeon]|nr:mechanosensitive ion channel family protein [Candidatus Micrarchaeota archaeon]